MSFSLKMVRLRHAADPMFTEFWLPLYRRAFPDNERISEEEVVRDLDDANNHIVVGCTSDGVPVCMAYCAASSEDTSKELPPHLYLIYLATQEEERGKGWGGKFFELLTSIESQSEQPPQALILEVQDVAEAEKTSEAEKVDAIRRVRFYEKHDCLLLSGSHYIQKVAGFPGVYMHWLCRPLKTGITPEQGFAMAQSATGEDAVKQIGELSWIKPTAIAHRIES